MKNRLLEIENLQVHYGRNRELVRAVDDVSLEIAEGEILGLVGESGCGKSTLGRAVLGLEPVAGGRIRFDGSAVDGLRGKALKRFRREAQMVFQDPYGSLNPRMTVGRAIEEVLLVHGLCGNRTDRRRRTAELLEDVGLSPGMADRYPHEFSGGQRQRIGIARALATGPRLLLADEPVSALDVSVQAGILKLILDLRRRHNLAYLFVSHDLAVVRNVSDRIAVMFQGKIVEEGSAAQICDAPGHAYTQRLLAAVPDLDAEATSFLAGRQKIS